MKKHFFFIFMFLLMTRICAFAYPNMLNIIRPNEAYPIISSIVHLKGRTDLYGSAPGTDYAVSTVPNSVPMIIMMDFTPQIFLPVRFSVL